MKNGLSSEFMFQIFALLTAVILVHAIYVAVIRPSADAQLEAELAAQLDGEEVVPKRSLTVVIRDFEQEACFILLLWALSIMGYKGRQNLQEQKLLEEELLSIPEGTSVLPEDARQYTRPIQALPEETRDFLLPRTLISALQRFSSTRNVQDVSEAVRAVCDTESDRLNPKSQTPNPKP